MHYSNYKKLLHPGHKTYYSSTITKFVGFWEELFSRSLLFNREQENEIREFHLGTSEKSSAI